MNLFERLSIITAAAAAVAAAAAALVAYVVYRGQKMLAQRQFIVPLWQYLSGLHEIDSNHPATRHVVDAANTLELVSLCCEGGMLDKAVIERTFRSGFVRHFEQIARCGPLPGLDRDGAAVLAQCPAASSLYRQLRQTAAGYPIATHKEGN